MYISAILLAAGRSTRMGADKLSLPYKGQPLLHRSLAPLISSALVSEAIVVVNPSFAAPLVRAGCTVVVNHDAHTGMASSLRTGVMAASALADAYLVSLADMPEIGQSLIATLVEAFVRSARKILVPIYEERQGHPVILDSQYRERLLRIDGDVGAREIIRENPEAVERVPVDDSGVVFDVDTPANLADGPVRTKEQRESTQ
ncbi:MAG: nucleotidyltransferase family protein [bacterium]|nr:nucleotidyltransferase family protein [bacterium]